jgi:cobalt/nickel transport system permease protein
LPTAARAAEKQTATADVLRQVMFSDDTAAQAGLLQRLDPRIKIVTLLGLLVVASRCAPCRRC